MPELATAYQPQQVENRLYAKWQDSGVYRANPNSAKKPYSIVMPPPNVTGKLHLGHVLNNTIQDILARKARMEGKEVLWLPGTDHAGLATQTMPSRNTSATPKRKPATISPARISSQRVWNWKERIRRHHHATAPQDRRVLRLVARTLHHRRGLRPRRAGSLREALP